MVNLLIVVGILLVSLFVVYFWYPMYLKDFNSILISALIVLFLISPFNIFSNDYFINSYIFIKAKNETNEKINKYNIKTNEPFILNNTIFAKNKNSLLNLFRNKKLSYKIEFFNSDANTFSEPIQIKSTEITKIEKTENSVIYHCNLTFTKKYLKSIIEFMGTPTKQGQQKIKITFDDKDYSSYNIEQTLIFENEK